MRYLIFCITFCCWACNNASSPSNLQFNLLVKYGPVRLLETPGEKGRPIANLATGTTLVDLQTTSSFVTPITINEVAFQTPWIKVQTPDGQRGWVYAAALAPAQANESQWLLQKKMEAFLGKTWLRQRNAWLPQLEQIQQVQNFATAYQGSLHLRDSLVQLLAMRTEPNEASFRPDYDWLTEALPGFVFQWVDGQPYLFTDYHFWGKMALKTNESTLDDQFIACCYAAFPLDSIESFFPAWMIQTDENKACSRLGAGKHVAMLKKIETLYQQLPARELFAADLERFKASLLRDILGNNTCYWQNTDKIIEEMNTILHAPLSILNTRDLLALKERIPMFRNAAGAKIRVNARNSE